MLKGYMWKYDKLKMKKTIECIDGIWTLRIMEINVLSATSDSIYWAIQDDIK